jgi:hypothetical protein
MRKQVRLKSIISYTTRGCCVEACGDVHALEFLAGELVIIDEVRQSRWYLYIPGTVIWQRKE